MVSFVGFGVLGKVLVHYMTEKEMQEMVSRWLVGEGVALIRPSNPNIGLSLHRVAALSN